MMLRIFRWIFAVGCLVIGTMWAANAAGLRYNHTASMPLGIWHVVSKPGYQRDDTVEACLPADWNVPYLGPGNCPGSKEPVLKVIVAVADDNVLLDEEGMWVNGLLLKDTQPLSHDGRGAVLHAYPAGHYTVGTDEIWLVSQEQISFDSRYFGPIKATSIRGAAKPIWTWE